MDKPEVVYREQLDEVIGDLSEFQPTSVRAKCHMDSALSVSYENGTLSIWCSRCGNHIFSVRVQSREGQLYEDRRN